MILNDFLRFYDILGPDFERCDNELEELLYLWFVVIFTFEFNVLNTVT